MICKVNSLLFNFNIIVLILHCSYCLLISFIFYYTKLYIFFIDEIITCPWDIILNFAFVQIFGNKLQLLFIIHTNSKFRIFCWWLLCCFSKIIFTLAHIILVRIKVFIFRRILFFLILTFLVKILFWYVIIIFLLLIKSTCFKTKTIIHHKFINISFNIPHALQSIVLLISKLSLKRCSHHLIILVINFDNSDLIRKIKQ